MSPAEGISAAPLLKIAQSKQEAERGRQSDRETAFVALAVCLCTCVHFVCMKNTQICYLGANIIPTFHVNPACVFIKRS